MRALIDIKINSGKGPVLLKDIARRQDISFKYLDHIITSLKVAGLVKNAGGRHGGYILKRDASDIYAYEVIDAMEGSLSLVECTEYTGNCGRSADCVLCLMYGRARDALKESFNISVEELAKRQEKIYAKKKRRKH